MSRTVWVVPVTLVALIAVATPGCGGRAAAHGRGEAAPGASVPVAPVRAAPGTAGATAPTAVLVTSASPASAASRSAPARRHGRRTWTAKARRRVQPDALFRVDTHLKAVALTFDDGPDPRWTGAVLDLLERYGDHATFFLVGRNALSNPGLVRAEVDAGHEIGDHTLDHAELQALRPDQVEAEIDGGARAVVEAGAPPAALFRPPRGFTDSVVAAAARRAGLRTVFWDVALERLVNHRGVQRGVEELLESVRPGSIVLAHDGGVPDRSRTLRALPLVLDGLRHRGYRVMTVSRLLALARPKLG